VPDSDGDEFERGKGVLGGFIVASCDTAIVLDLVKEVLDELMNPLIFAGTHIGPISRRMTGLNNRV
jgi:hypothetical protein